MNILGTISRLWPLVADASERWEDAVKALTEPDASEVIATDQRTGAYRVIDLRGEAATVRYRPSKRRKALGLPGRVKRTAYPPVDLRKRRVVLVMHQMGVALSPSQLDHRAKRVSAHEVWAEDGTVYVIHPDETRLIAANRLDRSPYHALSFELAGNLSYIEGQDRFYKPELLGRSRMTTRWALAAEARLEDRIEGLRACGIEPYMLAPHRVAGRDEKGRPNREACCASAGWAIAERVAARTGVPVPGEDYSIGGLTIPNAWRTEAFGDCRTVER